MKKWIFLIALFASSYAFGWHPVYRQSHDHGHYRTVCDYYYGCRTVLVPCGYFFHQCPLLISVRINTPIVPVWFNAQAYLFGVCARDYNMCLWNAHPNFCAHRYYACMGYY